jgi:hypothetical protein
VVKAGNDISINGITTTYLNRLITVATVFTRPFSEVTRCLARARGYNADSAPLRLLHARTTTKQAKEAGHPLFGLVGRPNVLGNRCEQRVDCKQIRASRIPRLHENAFPDFEIILVPFRG